MTDGLRIPVSTLRNFADHTARILDRNLPPEYEPIRAALEQDARQARIMEDEFGMRPYPHLQRGATYKQLAYISHLLGLSRVERGGFYRFAERAELMQVHADSIIRNLKGGDRECSSA